MSEKAPERIWIHPTSLRRGTGFFYRDTEHQDDDIEYVLSTAIEQARQDVWNKAIEVVQKSAKKSAAAGISISATEIAIRRLEAAARKESTDTPD